MNQKLNPPIRIYLCGTETVSSEVAHEILTFMERHFGSGSVVLSRAVETNGGQRLRRIKEEVRQVDIAIAVIGVAWTTPDPSSGLAKLHDENDLLRVQLECLMAEAIQVVPVLISPARLPRSDKLPRALRALSDCSGINAFPGDGFRISLMGVLEFIFPVVAALQESGSASTQKRDFADAVSQPDPPDQAALPPDDRSPEPPAKSTAPASGQADTDIRVSKKALMALAAGALIAISVWLVPKKSEVSKAAEATAIDAALENPDSTWLEADRRLLKKEIDLLRMQKPQPRQERLPASQFESSLGTPDYSCFEILDDERYWDLRGWVDLSKDANRKSYIILTRRIRIVKTSEADEIRFESRTDGEEVYLESVSNPQHSYEVVSSTPTFVGERKTKIRHLAINVSTKPIGEEFILVNRITFWNSMQDPKDRWLGAIGYPKMDKLRTFVLLPDGLPLRDVKLRTSPTYRDETVEYNGPKRLLIADDRLSLLWEVPTPESSRVYTMLLDW